VIAVELSVSFTDGSSVGELLKFGYISLLVCNQLLSKLRFVPVQCKNNRHGCLEIAVSEFPSGLPFFCEENPCQAG